MNEEIEQLGQAFREEAGEMLSDLEQTLLEWETRLEDPELVNRVFRVMHTLKGTSAMLGYQQIADFTHAAESVLDLVRSGRLRAGRELVGVTLEARDLIGALLNGEGDDGSQAEQVGRLQAAFARIAAGGVEPAGAAPPPQEPEPPPPPADALQVPVGEEPADPEERQILFTYRIRFKPGPELIRRGVDLIELLQELRGLGQARCVVHQDRIPPLEELDPERCYLYWDVFLTTQRARHEVRDVFIFVESDSELNIQLIDIEPSSAHQSAGPRLGEILVERGDLAPELLARTLDQQQGRSTSEEAAASPGSGAPAERPQRLGDLLIGSKSVEAGRVRAALTEQEHLRNVRARREPADGASSIRVPSQRLDALVDLVGELVTVQAHLSQTAGSQASPELSALAEEVERLTAELRDSAMTIRMVPIGTLFSRFNRLVRDLSQELEREVDMVISGTQTELDKTVIERLNDPLVHLVRNSLDHGIEPPAVRRAAGKPAQGRLEIGAEHSGASVVIRICDDGAGIDPERVRAKAVDRGLIAADAPLSRQEALELIFLPGFSTAGKVTGISGRGVGLDVVKRNIDSLRGSITVNSEPGQGTEILIRLPLTLAIIDGLLVAAGNQRFIVPLTMVEECVVLGPTDRASAGGRQTVTVRQQMVPYVSLRERFAIRGRRPPVEQVVIGTLGGQRFGLVVDRVVGNYQTVIKALGKVFQKVTDISGATILGDGNVALIVDMGRIYQGAHQG